MFPKTLATAISLILILMLYFVFASEFKQYKFTQLDDSELKTLIENGWVPSVIPKKFESLSVEYFIDGSSVYLEVLNAEEDSSFLIKLSEGEKLVLTKTDINEIDGWCQYKSHLLKIINQEVILLNGFYYLKLVGGHYYIWKNMSNNSAILIILKIYER